MAINKVVYGGDTLVDLTGDTVKPEVLSKGYTAHGADGEPIVGTMDAGAGGGGDAVADALVSGTLTEYESDTISAIRQSAFRDYINLASVKCPQLVDVGAYAFYGCSALTEADFQKLTRIPDQMFANCSKLNTVNMPKVTSIGTHAFNNCTKLTGVNLPLVREIGAYIFYNSGVIAAEFPLLTEIPTNAFASSASLTAINLPEVLNVGDQVFNQCQVLTNINLPLATGIGNNAFNTCIALEKVCFPSATSIGNNAFYGCKALSVVDLPVATSFGTKVFYNCSSLKAVVLRSSTLCQLADTYTFNNTLISSGSGYVYVPYALAYQYQTATNWSKISAQIRWLESYTVDGTVTGELDESKI